MVVTLLEVLGTVALLVSVLTVLGAAAATFLPPHIPATARWCLAPTLGLTISICWLTSVNWWLPGRTVVFVGLLPALACAAIVLVRRRCTMAGPPSLVSTAGPIALALIIATAFAWPLAKQHSLGPGAYQVWDGPNYASTQTGLIYNAVTDHDWGPDWSLSVRNGEHYIPNNPLSQQVGFDSVAATLDAATGLQPIQTQVPFMIGLVVIGALGAYAAFVMLVGSRLLALLAGLLYGGPVMYQLMLDGSEGAIAGITHLLPLVALGIFALRPGAGRAPAVLFALVAGSAAAAYPVFFPAIVAAAGLVWLITVIARARAAHGSTRAVVLKAVRGALLVAAGTALAAPFAFERSLGYWKDLIEGGGVVAGLPAFHLPLPVLPSYVLGTRDFYYLPHITDTNVTQWLLGDVLPLALLALVALAVLQLRRLWPLVVAALILLLVAVGVANSDCGYCVQRSLLPLGPISGFFLAAGVFAVATMRFRWATLIGTVAGVGVLLLVWHTNTALMRRGAGGAYFAPKSLVSALDRADQYPGPVLLEGFGGSYDAPGELPTALLAADGGGYRPGGPRLSVLIETNDFQGLAYLAIPGPAGPEFAPDYRTVITRLGTVRSQRDVLWRGGGLAIARRASPYDVTAENGFVLNRVRNADQRAFVSGPMSFVITGPPSRAVAVEVEVEGLVPKQLGKLRRGAVATRTAAGVRICVPASGQRSVIRRAVVPTPTGLVGFQSPGWYANRPVAVSGPVLRRMGVVSSCTRARP